MRSPSKLTLRRLAALFLVATSAAAMPAVQAEDGRGLFVRAKGEERFTFTPWKSEVTANAVFRALKDKGGEVRFAPGTYSIEQRLAVNDVPDLTVSGTSGTILEFAPGPERVLTLTAPVTPGQTRVSVDHPGDLRSGWRYQVYRADGRGDRILEFGVRSVEGTHVELHRAAKYMPHVKEIPAGSQVFVEVNIFRINRCPRLVIENLELRGNGRGTIRGHTIYCGIVHHGDYEAGRRPKTLGMTVRGCTFRGLNGRGIAFYGIGEARIENNAFHGIRAQAMEIDHFSSGAIVGNYVQGAEVGITLNDAFDSVVEANVFRDCEWGVKFMRIFDHDWVNTTNAVRDNVIGPGCGSGIYFRDSMTGNLLTGNRFVDLEPDRHIVGGTGNTIGD